MQGLRETVEKSHKDIKKKEYEMGPKASYGYGGKFGVEKDKKDEVNIFTKQAQTF